MDRDYAISIEDLDEATRRELFPTATLYVRSSEGTLSPYEESRDGASSLVRRAIESDYHSYSHIRPDALA